MEKHTIKENTLIGFGNPLLDISAVVDKVLLDKYNLKENDAIVANESHINLYKELEESYEVNYIVGGSVQNNLRVAQWLLAKPNVTTNFGCVGNDKYSKILYDKTTSNGVNVRYQYNETEPTGTCAVLITGHNRSLCANLGSASHYTVDHLKDPVNKHLVESAQFFYVSGYFLSVNYKAEVKVAKIALKNNCPFILNLSAPVICQDFSKVIIETLPFVDLLFGNKSEMDSLSNSLKLHVKNIDEIAMKISQLPKENKNRKRMVVITQATDPVIVAFEGKIQIFPVSKLAEEKIVDTNGAGDAFAGGFLSQFILGKKISTCVECGIWAATQIIQNHGCNFEGTPNFNENQ